ncbi:hypothetical protein GPALN_004946 [Globodera pallida]|nr:hypothetical protein GPALN_004946 [Globodera pallida]
MAVGQPMPTARLVRSLPVHFFHHSILFRLVHQQKQQKQHEVVADGKIHSYIYTCFQLCIDGPMEHLDGCCEWSKASGLTGAGKVCCLLAATPSPPLDQTWCTNDERIRYTAMEAANRFYKSPAAEEKGGGDYDDDDVSISAGAAICPRLLLRTRQLQPPLLAHKLQKRDTQTKIAIIHSFSCTPGQLAVRRCLCAAIH